MTQPGSAPPAHDLHAERDWLAAEIARRQAAIVGAEADVGRAIIEQSRTGGVAPDPATGAELQQIAHAEAAIVELQQQAYAIESEAAADAAALAALDPRSRCPACRSGVTPHQRYCGVCGEQLRRPAPVAVTTPGEVQWFQPYPGAPFQQYVQPRQQLSSLPECFRCGRPVDHDAGGYCTACGWRVGRSLVRWYRARWLRVGVIGLVLYAFCQIMLPHTDRSPALIIAELIIGASVVPITFIYYFAERGSREQTPFGVLAQTFVAGALLGCASAVILESAVHVHGNWGLIGVGFIEEGCKALIVLTWLRRRDLALPDKGLVIGAATGMGFAALETMQYAFIAFFAALSHGGSLSQALTFMTASLTVRGLLAPLGHGTWTAIVAAVVWYERAAGRSPIGVRALSAYVAVSLLHGLYDIAASSTVAPVTLLSGAKVSVLVFLVGLVGLVALLAISWVGRRGRDPVSGLVDGLARRVRGGPTVHRAPGGQG